MDLKKQIIADYKKDKGLELLEDIELCYSDINEINSIYKDTLTPIFNSFFEWHKKSGYVSIRIGDFEEYLNECNNKKFQDYDTKKKAIKEVGKPLLNPIGTLLIISFFTIISFPIVWIWFDVLIALKISGTGLIVAIILGFAYKLIESIVKETVEKDFDTRKKSKFQQKLEEMEVKSKTPNQAPHP